MRERHRLRAGELCTASSGTPSFLLECFNNVLGGCHWWRSRELPHDTGSVSKRRVSEHLHIRKWPWARLCKCLMVLVILVTFVPYDWWYRYIRGPEPVTSFPPDVYTGCAADDAPVRLAVVMPLTARELARAEANLRSWAFQPELAPCVGDHRETASAPLADFYFYFDLPLDFDEETVTAVERLKALLTEVPANVSRCFGSFSFISADMTPSESRNTYRHSLLTTQVATRGTVTQFYRLILDHAHMERYYTHAFYMETDTRPMRSGWLQALYRVTDSSVWVKGSIMRYPKPTVLGFEPYRSIYLYHINGNAIYRLGCPCFKSFLRSVRETYRDYAFDTSMAFYRLELRRYALFQRIAHRFAFTDVMADWCDYEFSLSDLGNTYLVHGKAQLSHYDWRKLGRY